MYPALVGNRTCYGPFMNASTPGARPSANITVYSYNLRAFCDACECVADVDPAHLGREVRRSALARDKMQGLATRAGT